MFLVNSRHPLVCATIATGCPDTMVTLLPKLRVHFAEFLQRSSLKRLSILYHSTCVGFGYGLMWGLFPGTASLHFPIQ